MATATALMSRKGYILSTIHSTANELYRGTAAGATYGVAKKANLFAVKVLDDSGCVRPLYWLMLTTDAFMQFRLRLRHVCLMRNGIHVDGG